MAFSEDVIKLLLSARRDGARFDASLTLGRQWLGVDQAFLRRVNRDIRGGLTPAQIISSEHLYADAFLHALGASTVDSIDASGFEGASIVHDLNQPVAEEHKGKYDAVVDAGTLEHVFNYPVAIKSAMEMVKVGGRVYLITPCNNYLGHGFYQFGPDLFFRVFCPANGFRVERMIAAERWDTRWLSVPDPAVVRRRVRALSKCPASLLVQAVRTEIRPIFEEMPQQSDYSAAWDLGEFKSAPGGREVGSGAATLGDRVPSAVLNALAWASYQLRTRFIKRSKTFQNRRNFKRVEP